MKTRYFIPETRINWGNSMGNITVSYYFCKTTDNKVYCKLNDGRIVTSIRYLNLKGVLKSSSLVKGEKEIREIKGEELALII